MSGSDMNQDVFEDFVYTVYCNSSFEAQEFDMKPDLVA